MQVIGFNGSTSFWNFINDVVGRKMQDPVWRVVCWRAIFHKISDSQADLRQ